MISKSCSKTFINYLLITQSAVRRRYIQQTVLWSML